MTNSLVPPFSSPQPLQLPLLQASPAEKIAVPERKIPSPTFPSTLPTFSVSVGNPRGEFIFVLFLGVTKIEREFGEEGAGEGGIAEQRKALGGGAKKPNPCSRGGREGEHIRGRRYRSSQRASRGGWRARGGAPLEEGEGDG